VDTRRKYLIDLMIGGPQVGLLIALAVFSVVAALFLGGCSATNISELVKAMADSKRSYCYTERSIYVQLNLSGTGIENGTVTCSPDGTMKVERRDDTPPLIVTPPQLR